MFELVVRTDFPAAHHLRGYPGDCSRVHGHNFGVEVTVRTRKLDELGLGVDFRSLKLAIKEVIGAWDHQDLNELPEFKEINPSAEEISRVLFKKLQPLIQSQSATLMRVTIKENCQYQASYFEEC